MRYLRDQKGIAINGSFQKRKLMNIGYYHGYKGYRYINKATNVIPYTSFDELTAVYEFDSQLKALFYPVVGTVNSDSFIDVYSQLLDNYKMFSTSGKTFKDAKDRK